MGGRPLVACQHCGTLHDRTPIEPRAIATCSRCGYVLYRQSGLSIKGWIALTLASLLVFAIANYFPVAIVDVGGKSLHATLPGALYLSWMQGHELLSIMTGLFGFWFPLTQLLVLLWALLALYTGRLPADFRYGMRMLHLAAPWSMIPVLMLGMLVAIVKFAGLATLKPGAGLVAFGVLTVLMTSLSRMSPHRIWRYAEDGGLVPIATADDIAAYSHAAPCSACGFVQGVDPDQGPQVCERCGAPVHYRKPRVQPRVWAMAITAAIVYIPANILPVMQVRGPMGVSEHTILGGVVELWRMDSQGLALIVFVASVVVPMTKLLALAVLMFNRQWRGRSIQRQRTRLYELIEFIGQWSMLDVFVVLLLTAMANFPGISQVLAGPGAASFGAVVVLTMFATMSYDPRSGWDNAQRSIKRTK
jgi:paraquat-inducible protein A